MKRVSWFLLLPLTALLLASAMNGGARKRLLEAKPVAALERRLRADGRLYWAAFFLCLLAGTLVRCWGFGVLPRGLNQDGTMAGVEAYCLLRDGVDQYGTSWPTYFRAWGFSQMSTLYSYLLIPFVKALGLNRFTLRLPMLLVSLAALPLAWDLARRIAGKGYALLVLFLLAINPWHILQSRWALEANLMPHVLLAGVYFLYLGRTRRWALYLSMVFFALTPYAYGLACFTVPVLLIAAACAYLAWRKARPADVLICLAVFAIIAGPYAYTMVINAFGLETATLGPITMPRFEDTLRANDLAPVHGLTAYVDMLRNLLAGARVLLQASGEPNYSAVEGFHTLYIFSVPLFLFGLYRLWSDRRSQILVGGG